MVMVNEADGLAFVEGAGAPLFEEQAANTKATPRRAVAAHRRVRPVDFWAVPSLLLAGRSVRRIARRSDPLLEWMYQTGNGASRRAGDEHREADSDHQ
jgi:hypothetical protein